jgi:hypothetical protein
MLLLPPSAKLPGINVQLVYGLWDLALLLLNLGQRRSEDQATCLFITNHSSQMGKMPILLP